MILVLKKMKKNKTILVVIVFLMIVTFLGLEMNKYINQNNHNSSLNIQKQREVITKEFFFGIVDNSREGALYTLTELDKEIFIKFININFEIVSKPNSDAIVNYINKHDIHTEIEYFVPKISTKPITEAYINYIYITKFPLKGKKGQYLDLYSSIKKQVKDTFWSTIYINNYSYVAGPNPFLTNFNQNDFKDLKFTFERKFFIEDLKENKISVNFSQSNDVDDFINSEQNGDNYAFYQFKTIRNLIPILITLGVRKLEYNPDETYPKNWVNMYIKRI